MPYSGAWAGVYWQDQTPCLFTAELDFGTEGQVTGTGASRSGSFCISGKWKRKTVEFRMLNVNAKSQHTFNGNLEKGGKMVTGHCLGKGLFKMHCVQAAKEAEAKRKLYSDKNWIEGVKLGRELYDKLLEWLPRREASAKELRAIADRLDQLRRDVNISRTVGSSVAVVGGLATIGSLILAVATAGLSTPLVVATVGGTAAAVAGAATSAISQIVESYKNGEEFKSARKIMEADESAAAEVAGLLEKLRIMGDRIISSSKGNYLVWDQFAVSDRQSSHMATQRILSAFMCFGAAASMGLPYKALAYSVSKGGGLAFHGMDKLGPLTSKLTQKLLFLSSKVGTIVTHGLGIAFAAVGLVLDVTDLVNAAVDLAKGSGNKASDSLRQAADQMDGSLKDLKDTLNNIQAMLKQMKNLTKTIKDIAESTGDENKQMKAILNQLKEICGHSSFMIEDLEPALGLAMVSDLRQFYKWVKSDLERRLRADTGTVDVVVLAHGHIEAELQPVSAYYEIYNVEDVVLYEPWNCLVNACAVFKIITGTITPADRQFYSLGSNHYITLLNLPHRWNSLPRSHYIPKIMLKPLTQEEEAYRVLQALCRDISRLPDSRIVFPYVYVAGTRDWFPEQIPFYLLVNVIALVGLAFNCNIKIHLAACLGSDQDLPDYMKSLCQDQYCLAPNNTVMTCNLHNLNEFTLSLFEQFNPVAQQFLQH